MSGEVVSRAIISSINISHYSCDEDRTAGDARILVWQATLFQRPALEPAGIEVSRTVEEAEPEGMGEDMFYQSVRSDDTGPQVTDFACRMAAEQVIYEHKHHRITIFTIDYHAPRGDVHGP